MIRVIRIGGSLLTWDHFLPTFTAWLDSQPDAQNVLIAGGGPWVELLRQAAKRFEIDERKAHWMCVRAMRVTAELLATILNVPMTSEVTELVGLCPSAVFDVDSFLQSPIAPVGGQPLPETWEVTSDSIAASVAEGVDALELVLLKSQEPPSELTIELAQLGYVDPFFPTASAKLPSVRFVNLRRWPNQ